MDQHQQLREAPGVLWETLHQSSSSNPEQLFLSFTSTVSIKMHNLSLRAII